MLRKPWFAKRQEAAVQHQVVHLEAALAQLDRLVRLDAAHTALETQTATVRQLRREIAAHQTAH